MINLQSLALRYSAGNLELLDQTLLPHKEVWILVKSTDEMISCIQKLQVRGAPLIGVAAALQVAQLCLKQIPLDGIKKDIARLREARPTAVNLMQAMDLLSNTKPFTHDSLVKSAIGIFEDDVKLCDKIATLGADLIKDGDHVLTHCNTGALATAGVGTALGIIHKAHEQGKKIHVWVDETRPLLQGGRLTAWELKKLGIPFTLICDNMAAHLMSQMKVQSVFVGCDRIAVNGDFANKIGTYSVAVNAAYHKIPFYVAGPRSTLDLDCPSGAAIPIEQRNAAEVRGVSGSFGSVEWAPHQSAVYNPAFDVTPADLVTGWVLDTGVYTLADVKKGALKC